MLQGAAIALFLWVGYVSRVYLAQPLTSNIHPMRNDPRVVPPQSSSNFLPFLSGSGESASAQIPLDGIWLGAAGIRSTEYGYTKICTNKKKEGKTPLL